MSSLRPPDLRLARRRLLALVDGLPSTGPAWHPAYALALRLRAQLVPLLAALDAALADTPTTERMAPHAT